MDPATKYEKTLFVDGELLDMYFLKLGIFKVALASSALPKGLSKDDLAAPEPEAFRCCCWTPATAARATCEGSCWRAQERSRAAEAELSWDDIAARGRERERESNCQRISRLRGEGVR